MNNMLWLIRREIWENRSLWIVPLVISGVILIAAAFGGIHIGGKGSFWIGTGPEVPAIESLAPEHRDQVRNAIAAGATEERQAIYVATLSAFTAVQLLAMSFVLFFYLLDSLLSERKDRSILFWKSLPVSDTEVVLSKLLTAIVVVPLFVLLVSSVLQVLFAAVWSIRFSGTVLDAALMAWHGASWLKVQALFLLFLTCAIPWYLPWLAYLMLVSVWARRNAFLWAVLPPVSILAIEGIIMNDNTFGEFLLRRLNGVFEILVTSGSNAMREAEGVPTIGDMFQFVGAVFTHYETWLGVLAAVAMIFASIRIRRYRDDN